MARNVFYSFHYDLDKWRVQTVKNIGAITSEPLLKGNQWEEVWRDGEGAIKRWIAKQMEYKTCLVVLTGSQTAKRPWVRYEIEKAWNDKRGVLGIRIDKLLDENSHTCTPGPNPFDSFTVSQSKPLSSIVKLKSPSGTGSKAVYADISSNIEAWVEEAIRIRSAN